MLGTHEFAKGPASLLCPDLPCVQHFSVEKMQLSQEPSCLPRVLLPLLRVSRGESESPEYLELRFLLNSLSLWICLLSHLHCPSSGVSIQMRDSVPALKFSPKTPHEPFHLHQP